MMKRPLSIAAALVFAVGVFGAAGGQQAADPLPGGPNPEGLLQVFCIHIRFAGAESVMSLLPPELVEALKAEDLWDPVVAAMQEQLAGNPVTLCDPIDTAAVDCGVFDAVGGLSRRVGAEYSRCARLAAWTRTADGEERRFAAAGVAAADGRWYLIPLTGGLEIPEMWRPPPVADPHADMASLGYSLCARGAAGDAHAVFDLMHPRVRSMTVDMMGGPDAWNALLEDAKHSIEADPVVACELVNSDERECRGSMVEILGSALGIEPMSCGVVTLAVVQEKTGRRSEVVPVIKIDGKWWLGGE